MRRVLTYLALGASLAAGYSAHSQEDERDVVVLESGNRLAGTIVALYRGELSFSIDGAGPVDIDWSNVESLTSGGVLDVELSTGERLSGSLASAGPGRLGIARRTAASSTSAAASSPRTAAPTTSAAASSARTAAPTTSAAASSTRAGPAGAQLAAGTAPGTASIAVDIDEVVRITPIAATPAERTSGYADIGLDFLTANDELDVNLNVGLTNRTRNYLSEASLDSLVSRLDGETAQKRNYFLVGTRRFLSNRWFAVGHLHFEEDRELDLDSRVLIGVGAGRTLIQSNRTILALHAGLAHNRERFRPVPGTDSTAEAFVAFEWDWFELGGDTELSTAAMTFFSFDRSRRRLELDANLRRVITGSTYWSLRLYESYDSDPPRDLEHSDFGITLGIGRSF